MAKWLCIFKPKINHQPWKNFYHDYNCFTMKKILFFLPFMVISLLSSCSKTKGDPCEGKKCPSNATCNNGKCECVNSYYVKGECVPKSDNTFYYAGKSCYCSPDTFALIINKTPGNNSASYQMRFQAPSGGALGSIASVDSYFPKPNGDSIRVVGILQGTFTNCDVKGKNCTSELIGKFNGPNQIDCTIRFFELSNYEKTIDECKITLKK
jgi:hypothetical protein